MGLVSMDRQGSDTYVKSTADNLGDFTKFVDFVRSRPFPLFPLRSANPPVLLLVSHSFSTSTPYLP